MSEVRCGPHPCRTDVTGNEWVSYWYTMTIPSEALCPGLLILPTASSQKGKASKGELAPLDQQIWVGHDGQDEWIR